jgi:hypothetical protein
VEEAVNDMRGALDAIQAETTALAERLCTLESGAERTDALNRFKLLWTRAGVLCMQANHDAARDARRKMDAATTKRDALVVVTCFNDAECDNMLGLVYGGDGDCLFYEGRDKRTSRDYADPLPEQVVAERLRVLPREYVLDDLMLEAAMRVALHNPVKPHDRAAVPVMAMLHPLTPPGYVRQIWAPCPDHRDQRGSWELDPDLLVSSAEHARLIGKRVRYEWPFRSPADLPTAQWLERHGDITVAERREVLRGLIDYANAHPNEVEQIRRGEPRTR